MRYSCETPGLGAYSPLTPQKPSAPPTEPVVRRKPLTCREKIAKVGYRTVTRRRDRHKDIRPASSSCGAGVGRGREECDRREYGPRVTELRVRAGM